MNIRRIRQFTLTILGCTLASLAPAVFGQDVSAKITGTVADAERTFGSQIMLFGDGSAKFIKTAVNLQVWQALGTRAGGETISADAY